MKNEKLGTFLLYHLLSVLRSGLRRDVAFTVIQRPLSRSLCGVKRTSLISPTTVNLMPPPSSPTIWQY
eukprot:9872378-Ditylum_brightwellii.AAC.1